MRILGRKSGFQSVRDLLSYGIGIVGLVFVLTRHDGATNYPAITLFLGFIGAPYVLQRDEKKNEDPPPDPEPDPKPKSRTPAKKTTAPKRRR